MVLAGVVFFPLVSRCQDQKPPGQVAYRISACDALVINVWHEPEISRSVPVQPDGKISLPLVGNIPVLWLTPTEVQELITERLEPYLDAPDVTVVVNKGARICPQSVPVLDRIQLAPYYPLRSPYAGQSQWAQSGWGWAQNWAHPKNTRKLTCS